MFFGNFLFIFMWATLILIALTITLDFANFKGVFA